MGTVKKWNNYEAPELDGSDSYVTIFIEEGAGGTLEVPEQTNVTIDSKGKINNGDNLIAINILATSKVIWKAEYVSELEKGIIIPISGGGTFEIVDGSISDTDDSDENSVIDATGTEDGLTIIVSGGEINATGDKSTAISASNGSIVKIVGGVVKSSGTNGTAINCSGEVTISGGIVCATGELGSVCEISEPTISGGLVVERNCETNNSKRITSKVVISKVEGTIVSYVLEEYADGKTNGLNVIPKGINVSWRTQNGNKGIKHPNGFFAV